MNYANFHIALKNGLIGGNTIIPTPLAVHWRNYIIYLIILLSIFIFICE
jgi:hypothetical protein